MEVAAIALLTWWSLGGREDREGERERERERERKQTDETYLGCQGRITHPLSLKISPVNIAQQSPPHTCTLHTHLPP